jgi:hypothetical protein
MREVALTQKRKLVLAQVVVEKLMESLNVSVLSDMNSMKQKQFAKVN